MALAVEDSPCFLPGAYQVISSVILDEPKIRNAFKTGAGVAWHQHCADLFEGTERFFRPGYAGIWCRNGFQRWTVSIKS